MADCNTLLSEGLLTLNIPISDEQQQQLLAFIKLIEKWNKIYNLTAIRKPEDMVRLHLLDSLTILANLSGHRIIDVGTGAGLPGIPLAICLPDLHFTLLDSNAKKTRFVQQAILELKLQNVEICHSRAESYRPQQRFDTVITRAFASLPTIIELTSHLLSDDGILLAMKSQHLDDELAQVSGYSICILKVPGVEAVRYVVRIPNPKRGH